MVSIRPAPFLIILRTRKRFRICFLCLVFVDFVLALPFYTFLFIGSFVCSFICLFAPCCVMLCYVGCPMKYGPEMTGDWPSGTSDYFCPRVVVDLRGNVCHAPSTCTACTCKPPSSCTFQKRLGLTSVLAVSRNRSSSCIFIVVCVFLVLPYVCRRSAWGQRGKDPLFFSKTEAVRSRG